MILFKNDWSRYPRAIVDYDTSNKSFVRMVGVYREMGVENCLWPLALLQPELQGVDPHAEDLSDAIKLKIALECKYNIWYVLREVIRIPPIAGPDPVPYECNRGNLALTWLFFANISVMLIQPRQTGKSVGADSINTALMYLMLDNTLITLLTKDSKLRGKNIERLKRLRDLLPSYLVRTSKDDLDNQTDLTCVGLDNYLITAVAQSSEANAINLGRGLTSAIIDVDEGPYIKNIRHTLPVMLSSGIKAKAEAKANNRPYADIFTTTAGKKDDPDGGYIYEMLNESAVWTERFLDAVDEVELKKMVDTNCSGRKTMVNCTFNHRQLGKTDDWLYEVISATKATGDNADRDLFNVWTAGSLSSPLSITLNETIKASRKEAKYTQVTKDSYLIRWFYDKDELESILSSRAIVLSVDTSDAVGRDFISLVFMDSTSLEILGGASINETNLIRFSYLLRDLLIDNPTLTLVIERKSSAQAIIDSLLITLPSAGIDPFKRIYNKVIDESTAMPQEYKELSLPMERRGQSFYDRLKRYFGFNTTGSSRTLLYTNVLQDAAINSGSVVNDPVLVDEILGLIVKNNRIDHVNTGHDDMVIAWLMGHWFLTYSKNLAHYGIDATKIRSRVGDNVLLEKPKTHSDARDDRALEQAKVIYEKLSDTTDSWKIAKYETMLRRLNQKTDLTAIDSTSIDGMIQSANELRRKKQMRRSLLRKRMSRH